jgi:hypothetical protein
VGEGSLEICRGQSSFEKSQSVPTGRGKLTAPLLLKLTLGLFKKQGGGGSYKIYIDKSIR